MLKKMGFVLVLLMAVLQGFYGMFAFVDPVTFADVRGTALASNNDIDWIKIYASRTLFVALVVGFLLYLGHYRLLVAVAIFGTVMPITDGWLAFQAGATSDVVIKHVLTFVYLVATAVILHLAVHKDDGL